MKSWTRALALASATFITTATSGVAIAAPSGVSCVVPNLWKAEPRADFAKLTYQQSVFESPELSTGVAQEVQLAQLQQREIAGLREQLQLLHSASYSLDEPETSYAAPTTSWKLTYKGTGYDRLKGEARERVARGGVLWLVRPASLGATQASAIQALMDAGATVARPGPGGLVEFRAPRDVAAQVADTAAASLGGSARSGRVYVPGRAAYGLKAETAMLRLEGRTAQTAEAFIENLPTGGMTVYPFGTSYVVHVRPSDLEQLRYYLEDQGNSVVLVGSSMALVNGAGIAYGIRSCGANVLADRFPTPAVQSSGMSEAVVRVESQMVPVTSGDIMIVVQKPAYGGGLEVALVRFAN